MPRGPLSWSQAPRRVSSVSTQPVRVGIIGCGNVLAAYMELLASLRGEGLAEAVAACGREAQRERAVGKFRIQRFATDHRRVIDAPDVDLVLILTSMPSHGRLVLEALAAGKHVLVEKPLAVSLDEAARVVAAARQSRGLLACAPFTVLSPTFQAIRRRLQAGDVGRVVSARARYGWAGPDWAEWFYRPGGGALFDLGVYNLTTLTGLLGPARRVAAMAGAAIHERDVAGKRVSVEVEDNAHVLVDFGGAVFAVVTTGFTIQQYRCPAIELYGTAGTIQMLGDDWDPDGYELWTNAAGAWQIHRETDPGWPWTDGLRHLIECIRTGTRPVATPEHAYHVLEVMLQAQASARDGAAREVRSSFPPLAAAAAPGEPAAAHRLHDRTRRE
ncbi:MAG: Gfo/Idh/MocA family oxidoreductase [Planctomycetes bacterium]|nr:Gfo/Idh/MocA family oxidoreductase [Planctomycetota bacterium]